ncbi:mycofactocin biosynthesis peptidyl-dipeptidase MftE [Pseudonocardia asaccharolytica]|uniref:Putative mycofactocin system creatinine amidohydrolase family protein MftE n=1 Tax=Pseudonocardia asaccharolytica DSM 44247 = NBRC 16224 TaxID=1123024 RepID=A0A511CWW1_9PSEU|nr:mycofactocin biosynthesis peptidyl-dipeptidase MftE [Pseudonocardia asaccharolytica]GEL17042.1 putative mycofactocin system creatinine amidohydrolase family protein MftE [Pseudonocardia asaccharolytica DSM 44247 = NBRC 16224]
MPLLQELTWSDLDSVRPTLVVPVGSVEQHGAHLPLHTDVRIAAAVAALVLAREPALVVAPAVAYGAAGEHEGFAGTVSIGHAALRLLLVELGRSACRWAGRLVLLNGHGGNVPTLVEVVRLLRDEGRDAAWVPCVAPGFDGDAHAGRTETSLMLALDPDAVRAEHAVAGNTAPLRELLPAMRDGGVAAVSPNGVLGDPTGASAQEGQALLGATADAVVAAIRAWCPTEDGRLRP